eukprot:scpid44139/ scgid14909/ 
MIPDTTLLLRLSRWKTARSSPPSATPDADAQPQEAKRKHSHAVLRPNISTVSRADDSHSHTFVGRHYLNQLRNRCRSTWCGKIILFQVVVTLPKYLSVELPGWVLHDHLKRSETKRTCKLRQGRYYYNCSLALQCRTLF